MAVERHHDALATAVDVEIRRILVAELGVQKIAASRDQLLSALPLDSLSGTTLLVGLEDHFGVAIELEWAESFNEESPTLADLAHRVAELITRASP